MAFKVLQNTKINSKQFAFKNVKTVSYPVAPLVSTNFYTPKDGPLTLKIRATLYINSETPDAAVVETPTEEGTVLTLYFDCSFSDQTPRTCDVWYIEVDYTSETVGDITKIISFLRNTNVNVSALRSLDATPSLDEDPPTSRGTETRTTDD